MEYGYFVGFIVLGFYCGFLVMTHMKAKLSDNEQHSDRAVMEAASAVGGLVCGVIILAGFVLLFGEDEHVEVEQLTADQRAERISDAQRNLTAIRQQLAKAEAQNEVAVVQQRIKDTADPLAAAQRITAVKKEKFEQLKLDIAMQTANAQFELDQLKRVVKINALQEQLEATTCSE